MRMHLQSYEGFHVGCMYNEPMRLFLDSDEKRFGGFGRLTPRTQHPATEAKDSRPHSVRVYLPSSTCAVYVRESVYCEKQPVIDATPVRAAGPPYPCISSIPVACVSVFTAT